MEPLEQCHPIAVLHLSKPIDFNELCLTEIKVKCCLLGFTSEMDCKTYPWAVVNCMSTPAEVFAQTFAVNSCASVSTAVCMQPSGSLIQGGFAQQSKVMAHNMKSTKTLKNIC